MRRVLIANRGEIALRAIRTCRRLGLQSVAVYSSADGNSPHRWAADHAVCIGPPPPKASYLNAAALIEVASACQCDAVYPGYGFLAEDPVFAARCAEAGLIFIGPSAEVIARMGDKVAARQTAAALGIPVVPGSNQGFTAAAEAKAHAEGIGFPLLLKASAGGGGRGMRVVTDAEAFSHCSSRRAPKPRRRSAGPTSIWSVFSESPPHRNPGIRRQARQLCATRRARLQRAAPASETDRGGAIAGARRAARRAMADAALALIRAIEYVNAGTVEFIYDVASGRFFFIEMNTRIQVEHPVTEMVTGNDLVAEQFRVAAGERLRRPGRAAMRQWRSNSASMPRTPNTASARRRACSSAGGRRAAGTSGSTATSTKITWCRRITIRCSAS